MNKNHFIIGYIVWMCGSCGPNERVPEQDQEQLSVVQDEFFDTYFTGNLSDKEIQPEGGICMMGGRTEFDPAMRWFLQRANGGDILVLRASGADGYNDYMFNELGLSVNSVESIVFRGPSLSEYIIRKIDQAEAIWFAGGDQGVYLRYWKANAIQEALHRAVDRNVVIGGTSAGMAILGQYIWDGENIQTEFLQIPWLENTITDTHYDARNRYDRHIGFIREIEGKGIAADEYTAICIYPDGKSYVYGNAAYDDNGHFINEALEYQVVKGTALGTFAVDLSEW